MHSKSIFCLVEYLVRVFEETVIHGLHRNDQLTTLFIQLLKKLEQFIFTRKIKLLCVKCCNFLQVEYHIQIFNTG